MFVTEGDFEGDFEGERLTVIIQDHYFCHQMEVRNT